MRLRVGESKEILFSEINNARRSLKKLETLTSRRFTVVPHYRGTILTRVS